MQIGELRLSTAWQRRVAACNQIRVAQQMRDTSDFGKLFRGSWVQTSGSVQFVTVVRRVVWEVSAEFRGSELVAVVCCWLWRLPGVGSALAVFSRSG